jgi:hypothetical protein
MSACTDLQTEEELFGFQHVSVQTKIEVSVKLRELGGVRKVPSLHEVVGNFPNVDSDVTEERYPADDAYRLLNSVPGYVLGWILHFLQTRYETGRSVLIKLHATTTTNSFTKIEHHTVI